MNKVIACIGCSGAVIVAACVCFCQLMADVGADVSFYSRGNALMSLVGIANDATKKVVSSWTMPTSVVVTATSYQIVPDNVTTNSFEVFSVNSTSNCLFWGRVEIMSNAMVARKTAFASLADCSIAVADLAEYTVVTPIGSATNMLCVSYSKIDSETASYLVTRNVIMRFGGLVSNRLDFATALLNAGLPENERVPQNGNGGTQSP